MNKYFALPTVVLILCLPFAAQAQFQAGKSHAGPAVGLSFLGSTFQFGANYEYGMKTDFGTVGVGGLFRYWSYGEEYLSGE